MYYLLFLPRCAPLLAHTHWPTCPPVPISSVGALYIVTHTHRRIHDYVRREATELAATTTGAEDVAIVVVLAHMCQRARARTHARVCVCECV